MASQPNIVSMAPPATAPRWLEVVSHIDPRYGGLSASVPALGRRIGHDSNIHISLAAFCSKDEQCQPPGYTPRELSFWPASRGAWLRNQELRDDFNFKLRGMDGVHIHGLWEHSTAIAAQSAHSLKIPYILSAHGMLEPWALANKRFKKWLYSWLIERSNVSRATCLHALTHTEARQYIAFGARAPIAVIPNGVDIPARKDRSLFLSRFPQLAGRRIVLYLSRLHRKKGPDLLLKAWAEIGRKHPEASLVLAGPDSDNMQTELERIVAEHKMEDSVLFAGMVSGPMKWSAFAAAECFVLPSHSEGLSVSVLEAMGMGLPVILSTACNMPQIVHHRAGWQIEPRLDDLIDALNEALDNSPFDNLDIGCRGAALIQAHYTWKTVAAQMAELYRWVQGGPMPRSLDLVFPGAV